MKRWGRQKMNRRRRDEEQEVMKDEYSDEDVEE